MNTFIEKNLSGEACVIYQFYTVEEAESHYKSSEVWEHIVNNFKVYLGKQWVDLKSASKQADANSATYKTYTVIGVEDNNAWNDYYWILQDNNDNDNIKYELVNNPGFKNGIIIEV